ncbi:MAG: (d)CMP kinase [Verrucomicrobia bacterium]|nr:(d)CMP kinase [Verrucomicrobiota bacterium]
MQHHTVIAIDGPAASGKSSASRILASRLGYIYVNTGGMYRAATWLALRLAVNTKDSAAVEQLMHEASFECVLVDGVSRFLVNGEDPADDLTSPEVNAAVSQIATLHPVRTRLVALQRDCALAQPVVMEGRDIGTVVFPETPYKFYIDASAEVRAARRAGQGLKDSVTERDAMDSGRKESPLTVAPDAQRIDTSHMNLEQVVEEILARLKTEGIEPHTA